jgi:hypothetical protein
MALPTARAERRRSARAAAETEAKVKYADATLGAM